MRGTQRAGPLGCGNATSPQRKIKRVSRLSLQIRSATISSSTAVGVCAVLTQSITASQTNGIALFLVMPQLYHG